MFVLNLAQIKIKDRFKFHYKVPHEPGPCRLQPTLF
jgi:hypothetical protein